MNFNQEGMETNKEEKPIEINGMKFFIHPFKAIESLKLKSVILQKFGPAIGQLFGSLTKDLSSVKNINDVNIDGESFSNALMKLSAELNEDEFTNLILRFLKNTIAYIKTPQGEKVINLKDEESIDIVFRGKTFSIYKLIFEILKVNYPDFFGQMEGIGYQLKTGLANILKEKEIQN